MQTAPPYGRNTTYVPCASPRISYNEAVLLC